ncbi:hypothetical protein B0H12DRAFT_1244103 [Mycena haematopus]|nr:hypothetical protein B0H12DRAFT_1244103 [Mycena haematopus]
MSNTHRACTPPFRPSAGDEDVREHSVTAGQRFYVVGLGYIPGIYTQEFIARQQVTGFSNGQWKRAQTYASAVAIWNEMCAHYHTHDSPEPSPPPPSPSPSPPSTPPRRPQVPAVRLPTAPTSYTSGARSPRSPVPAPAPVFPRASSTSTSTPTPSRRSTTRMPVITTIQPTSPRRSESRILWGIQGISRVFDDRYQMIDHMSSKTACVMQTRNRRKLEAFIAQRPYRRQAGDPEESESE